MNREDLLEAIGTADEEMLEKSEKRTKRNWMISVAAACLCCVIGLAAFFVFQPKTHRIVMENIS
jgi:amino acid permease